MNLKVFGGIDLEIEMFLGKIASVWESFYKISWYTCAYHVVIERIIYF